MTDFILILIVVLILAYYITWIGSRKILKRVEPEIGEVWFYTRTSNPWDTDIRRVKIIGKKDGWVRYCYNSFGATTTGKDFNCLSPQARTIKDFLLVYNQKES